MRWDFSYIGGFIIISLMVFYFFKGLLNLIKLRKVSVILFSLGLAGIGITGFLNIHEFPKEMFFWVFSLSLLLILDTLLIGLHFSKKDSIEISENEYSLKSGVLLLILSVFLFISGILMKKLNFISIVMLFGFMYSFLVGSNRIISKLK